MKNHRYNGCTSGSGTPTRHWIGEAMAVRRPSDFGPSPLTSKFSFDPAQPAILPAGGGNLQGDLVIPQDRSLRLAQALAANMAAQVVGARDPEYAAFAQMEKIGKMHVSLVENRDLSSLQPRAQGQGPRAVVMGSFFNDGKAGKKTLQSRRCIFAAALRRRSWPSPCSWPPAMGWNRSHGSSDGAGGSARPDPKPGESSCRCPSTFQNSAYIMSLSRSLLACERVFRLGATAPLIKLGRMMPQGVADSLSWHGSVAQRAD